MNEDKILNIHFTFNNYNIDPRTNVWYNYFGSSMMDFLKK